MFNGKHAVVFVGFSSYQTYGANRQIAISRGSLRAMEDAVFRRPFAFAIERKTWVELAGTATGDTNRKEPGESKNK